MAQIHDDYVTCVRGPFSGKHGNFFVLKMASGRSGTASEIHMKVTAGDHEDWLENVTLHPELVRWNDMEKPNIESKSELPPKEVSAKKKVQRSDTLITPIEMSKICEIDDTKENNRRDIIRQVAAHFKAIGTLLERW